MEGSQLGAIHVLRNLVIGKGDFLERGLQWRREKDRLRGDTSPKKG